MARTTLGMSLTAALLAAMPIARAQAPTTPTVITIAFEDADEADCNPTTIPSRRCVERVRLVDPGAPSEHAEARLRNTGAVYKALSDELAAAGVYAPRPDRWGAPPEPSWMTPVRLLDPRAEFESHALSYLDLRAPTEAAFPILRYRKASRTHSEPPTMMVLQGAFPEHIVDRRVFPYDIIDGDSLELLPLYDLLRHEEPWYSLLREELDRFASLDVTGPGELVELYRHVLLPTEFELDALRDTARRMARRVLGRLAWMALNERPSYLPPLPDDSMQCPPASTARPLVIDQLVSAPDRNKTPDEVLLNARERLPFLFVDDPDQTPPLVERLLGLPDNQAVFRIRHHIEPGWHMLWGIQRVYRDPDAPTRAALRLAALCSDTVLAPLELVPTLLRAGLLDRQPDPGLFVDDDPVPQVRDAERYLRDLALHGLAAEGATLIVQVDHGLTSTRPRLRTRPAFLKHRLEARRRSGRRSWVYTTGSAWLLDTPDGRSPLYLPTLPER